MSTRATIAVRRRDTCYEAVYLHFDGYPAHAGETLKQHFSMQSQAEELVAGGELRCLDRESGTAERYSNSGEPAILLTYDALIEFARNCGAQFVYVFDDAAWTCREL